MKLVAGGGGTVEGGDARQWRVFEGGDNWWQELFLVVSAVAGEGDDWWWCRGFGNWLCGCETDESGGQTDDGTVERREERDLCGTQNEEKN